MDTDEVVEEWHFEQASHGYKFYMTIPTNGCYRLSAINPAGTGIGNGLIVISDGNNQQFIQVTQNINVFTYKYSYEFECDNAGLDENASNDVTVYPNPASNRINITGENISEVLIYNALGQIVYSKSVDDDAVLVDTSAFEEGLYVVNVKNANGESYSQRIIVKK